MRFNLIAGLSVLVLALTGCSDLVTNLNRDLTKSDITKEELQSLLVVNADFQGFDAFEQTATERSELNDFINKNRDNYNFCNDSLDSYAIGDILYSEASRVIIYSVSAPVCGRADAAKDSTKEYYIDLNEKTLREQLETQEFVVSEVTVETVEVDLGLGSDVLSYKTLFSARSESGDLEGTRWEMFVFSNKAAVNLIVETYLDDIPIKFLEQLTNLTRLRLAALESGTQPAVDKLQLPYSNTTANDSVSPEADTSETVDVYIDPIYEELLNPSDGQGIEPNSIPIEFQNNLSEPCRKAVKPIRDIMKKTSGLQASEKQLNNIGNLRIKAENTCDPQEYADWYIKEFVGWLYSE